MIAIQKAVEIIGGQTVLANQLGIRQGHVWNWLHRHKQAPAKYIRFISTATQGAVSVDELLLDHETNHQLKHTA
ncbi:YdaS family helix-turn-helix protein [Shewanella xiamenensis]|uniref:YdaS family helix-turn-helix protein n=1 Tax=Shewanella xiamenensis TaxID=332186 RepID=UPI00313AACD9